MKGLMNKVSGSTRNYLVKQMSVKRVEETSSNDGKSSKSSFGALLKVVSNPSAKANKGRLPEIKSGRQLLEKSEHDVGDDVSGDSNHSDEDGVVDMSSHALNSEEAGSGFVKSTLTKMTSSLSFNPISHRKRKPVVARSFNMDTFVLPCHPKSDEEKEIISAALDKNFAFFRLSSGRRQDIIGAMEKEHVKCGHTIIKKGDDGDYFYILHSGSVSVVKDIRSNKKEEIGSYTSGDSFGELALLYNKPRAVCCIATSDCILWKIDHQSFRFCVAKESKQMDRRISNLIRELPLLTPLTSQQRMKFVDCLVTINFIAGEPIFSKGDIGRDFYIIKDGEVKVHDIGATTTNKFTDVTLCSGEWFGELALINDERRNANVTATTDCVLYKMSRQSFETTIGPIDLLNKRHDDKKFLLSIPVFSKSNFTDFELDTIIDKFTKKTFKRGEFIDTPGEPVTQSLHIIDKGSILITDNKNGDMFKLKDGDYFGDSTLKSKEAEVSMVTITVEDDTVCNVLTKDDLLSVIGDTCRLHGCSKGYVPSFYKPSLELEDLEFGNDEILGEGDYGKVMLVRSKQTIDLYALKTFSKRQLVNENQVDFVLREKKIMQHIDHPFILGLVANFQDESRVYLMMPIVNGGELFRIMHPKGCKDKTKHRLPLESAVFYSACVMESLDYLHLRSIGHRDLKPENLLIDKSGYCVLKDFALAKVTTDLSYTMCGTPEYMAPEIIMGTGHNYSVDCWAFAILVYEMLVGKTPFYSKKQLKMFSKIATITYAFPSSPEMDPDAQDLIQRLLVPKFSDRLGHSNMGGCEVKNHPFFTSIDWDKLIKKTVDHVPWIPEVKDKSYDSSIFSSQIEEPSDDDDFGKELSEVEQSLFKDF